MRRTYLSDEEDVELRAPTEVKMLILGAPRVGKTSFITRLTQGYFTMFYNPTKLIEIHREVKVGDLNFTCWDIPATIRYHFKLTCLTADVVLLMFDSTRPNTKEMVITYWKKLYTQLKNIPYIFVTLLTSQLPISWLKNNAPKNISLISVTLLTFQLPIS